MKFVDEETERQTAMTQALFTKMEEKPLSLDEAGTFFALVHPYPADARTYIPAELVMKENTDYANERQKADESREILMALFAGQGIGITKTLYGAYNCVTEMQNHHIMSKKNDGTESILIGARGKVMDNALEIAKTYI
jgi:hypothetical protein